MELIEGRQPVREALRAGRPMRRLMIAEGAQTKGALEEILELARAAGVRVDRLPRAALDERATTRSHQGVIAEASPVASRSWRDGVAMARAAGVAPLLIAFDGIEDPQNLGALLRSAEVLGAHGALVPKRRSAPLGAAVGKASAGALEHLPIDQVDSLERALASCKKEGLWVVALAGGSSGDIRDCALLEEPVVIVVGAEGKGVSHLIRERADALVRIPMSGKVASLNASVAGAIALWEVARRRGRD